MSPLRYTGAGAPSMLPEPGSCAASSGCSPGGNSAVPAQDEPGAPANSGCCRHMPRGEPRPLAGKQDPGRLEPPRWNPLSPADPRAVPGHPGSTSWPACRQSPFDRPGLYSWRARAGPLSPRAPLPSCIPPGTGFEGRAGLSIF